MSPQNQSPQESNSNSQLKSSIVHKPFATGTINIFNPHRTKGNKTKDRLAAPKLYLDAQLESEELATTAASHKPTEVDRFDWLARLLNFWSVSAIAIVFLANLISAAVIWRNYRSQANIEPVKALVSWDSANIASEEFMPLNLSTLSRLKMPEEVKSQLVAPIVPALAPINLAQSNSEPQYYYILTEYNGDASIASAKQKVEQVSLVNLPQGVFIYLGAYKERDRAEEFIDRLQQENFAADIYPAD